MFGKKYSIYINPKSKDNNKIPVKVGSVIVANISDYEKTITKGSKKDHRKEAVTVLKAKDDTLGVVLLHGKKDAEGVSRDKKVDSGLWAEVKKSKQDVYVDIDVRTKDSKGNDIKQGSKFQNTAVVLSPEEMKKVESHIYMNKGRKSHSIRNIISSNKSHRDKKNKA